MNKQSTLMYSQLKLDGNAVYKESILQEIHSYEDLLLRSNLRLEAVRVVSAQV